MIGSNILNIALVIPIIGFTASNESLDSILLNRDMLVLSFTFAFALLYIYKMGAHSETCRL